MGIETLIELLVGNAIIALVPGGGVCRLRYPA